MLIEKLSSPFHFLKALIVFSLSTFFYTSLTSAQDPPPPPLEEEIPTALPINEISETSETPSDSSDPLLPAPDQQTLPPAPLPPGQSGYDGLPIDPNRPIQIRILSPAPREILPDRDVYVFLDVINYKLAENGNRLHLIHNNKPPITITDLTAPVKFKNLSEGGHTIRVYAVKPNGESFPSAYSYTMLHFYVKRKDFSNYMDPHDPYITINLPLSGTIDSDDLGRILFDYRIHNATFDTKPGYKLKYTMTGFEDETDQAGPIYWDDLPEGKHSLTVELFDKNDKAVPGPFNKVKREFTVRKVLKAQPLNSPDSPETLMFDESQIPRPIIE